MGIQIDEPKRFPRYLSLMGLRSDGTFGEIGDRSSLFGVKWGVVGNNVGACIEHRFENSGGGFVAVAFVALWWERRGGLPLEISHLPAMIPLPPGAIGVLDEISLDRSLYPGWPESVIDQAKARVVHPTPKAEEEKSPRS